MSDHINNGELRVDLHVHSIYSERPSEWILKTIGTKESYTDPETIYRMALDRGMDFVTITDHNKIEGVLLLKEKYPDRVFTGVELTSYFPEDGCKVHLLIYGFTEAQFKELNQYRSDVYVLRDYLKQENLAYSLAHATYSVNKKLTIKHLEKMLLLFDVFEGINGHGAYHQNHVWMETLHHIDPDQIDRLYRAYRIEPFSDQPWFKGITGGSDDHAGIFIGKTYTLAPAVDQKSFLEALREKRTKAAGRHNDFHSLAFMVYKIGYEFSKERGGKLPETFLSTFNETLFENRSFSVVEKLVQQMFKANYKRKGGKNKQLFLDAIKNTINKGPMDIEEKFNAIYDILADFSDRFFFSVFESLAKDFSEIDIIKATKEISSSLFGVLVVLPFITTLRILFQDRELLNQVEKKYLPHMRNKNKRIAWFSDTLTEMNGVSMTLKKIGWLSAQRNKELNIVTCLLDQEMGDDLPPNVELLPHFFHFTPSIYDCCTIKIPSLLKSLKKIYELNPDEIIISTPGPVGVIGLLAAKLMSVRTKTIYHTDYREVFERLIEDNHVLPLGQTYMRWFYNLGDEILVPTKEYMKILEERGFDKAKMTLFKRGIDLQQYQYKPSGKEFLRDFAGLADGPTLLYTGRISKDKNPDFLRELYQRILSRYPDTNLVIAGDGPYLAELKESFKGSQRVHFCGLVDQKVLPNVYSGADLFIFPSNIDTFGMAVLEAQACGLPAVVSDKGGPKEIIKCGKTGLVAKADDIEDWEAKVLSLIELIYEYPEQYRNMRAEATARAREHYNWDKLLNLIFEREQEPVLEEESIALKAKLTKS